MWELDHKEGWVPKNWCFRNVVLEKTLESPLDYKEIKPSQSKRNQSWIFIGRTDVEAEAPILWPPDVKKWLVGKDPDAGKDREQEVEGMTEDKMVGWHHWLSGHEFEQTQGGTEEQGSLMCCSPWCCKESSMTLWRTISTTTIQPIIWGVEEVWINWYRKAALGHGRKEQIWVWKWPSWIWTRELS